MNHQKFVLMISKIFYLYKNIKYLFFSAFSILQQMENESKRPHVLSPVRSISVLEAGISNLQQQPASIRRYRPFSPHSTGKSTQQQRPKITDRRRSSATVPLARSKEELENLLVSANIDPNKPVCFFKYF